MRGAFITIEGTEGAGKSSAVETARGWLQAAGHRVVCTREPGGTGLGEELREVLLSHRDDGMTPAAEVLLMFAARAEHIERVIRPALDAGDWVICDRFSDASIAYQGSGRGLGVDQVQALAAWLHPDLQPDLTLWLDLPVETGLARAAERSAPDRFEREKTAFFERVRAGYQTIAERAPDRVRRIDAAQSPAEVSAAIIDALQRFAHVD
ncbi:dTMP kinase [Spiribacter pallidus]|jgi:dTMP kinase|uniref:dTMP kinase n=1 Tax=Spiribacter pallidus TaxID=1987936 RepID=UPI00349FE1B7